MKIHNLAFIDTETTGLIVPNDANLYAQPHVTQIYLLLTDKKLRPIKEFETYVKPPIPIPEEITRFTRISNETVANAPTFIEIYDTVSEFFIGESEVLGQNINFDMGVLKYELRRIDREHYFPYPPKRHDTIEMAFPINNRRMRLGELHEHCFGTRFQDSHSARADAEATLRCFKWLMDNGFGK